MTSAPLMSVVLPAFNAERWIDRTLLSVRSQTYEALEIVVVDDGSSDRTAELVGRHTAVDARVRLVRQENAGVAAARNRGLAETSGEFVATIDADDLWAPDKIRRQLAVFQQAGEEVGLVYARSATIDAEGRITRLDRRPGIEGAALEAMCVYNVVGNGSAAMMRRAAVVEAGGYDPGLRAARAEGCEDYKLYFTIAERFRFAFVDDWLVGYRDLQGSMSSNVLQMIRSRDLCVAELRTRHPQHLKLFKRGRMRLLRNYLGRVLRLGRRDLAALLLKEMLVTDLLGAISSLAQLGGNLGRSIVRDRAAPEGSALGGQLFPVGDAGPVPTVPGSIPARIPA